MNNDERYQGQAYYQHYSGSSVPQSSGGRPATDPVQDAYRLMAMYPLASATPVTHGKYHIFVSYDIFS